MLGAPTTSDKLENRGWVEKRGQANGKLSQYSQVKIANLTFDKAENDEG